MLFSDPPVSPAAEEFLSVAHGTHGWENLPCWAGDTAVRRVAAGWWANPVSVDIESFGLDQYSARLKCVSFSDERSAIVLDPRDTRQRTAIREIIQCAPRLIFHNSAFDVPNLARNGLFTVGDCTRVEDTLVHSRLAEPDSLIGKNLIKVGARYLGTPATDHLLAAFKVAGLTKEQGYYQFDIDRYMYLLGSASDAVITARLLPFVRQAAYDRLTTGHPFTENGVTGAEAWELVDNLQRFNRIMLRRACLGLRVDVEFLDAYTERTGETLSRAEQELVAHHVRPGHAGDLIAFLDKHDALPEDYPRTAKTKAPSTVAGHLERLAHPLAQVFVQHKQITKIKDDYLQKAVNQSGEDGRIYPANNVLAAVTGRTSISGVPLHQYPKPARGIVLCDEGDPFTSVDWAQQEAILPANIAGDLDVVLAYEAGADFHQTVANAAGITRDQAKVTVFAQLYGEGIKKLAADLGIPEEEAVRIRSVIFDALPHTANLVRAKSACVQPGQQEGLLRRIARDYGLVFTLSGRIVPVPMGKGWVDEETGKVGPPSRAVHKGVNYFVQGGAFDMLMDTVLRGDDAGLADTLYLTMHDELVVSTSAAEEWEKIMQTPPERLVRLAKRVPVLRTDRADMGERWAKV